MFKGCSKIRRVLAKPRLILFLIFSSYKWPYCLILLFVNLICPSQELMNQPVSMVCGHSACKACLEEMVSKSLQGNGKTCPLCRETITLRKMNTNLAVRAMIPKILVHCINSGCAWTGEHDEMQNHSAICPFKIVSCPNGCQESYRQDAMDLHLAACPFQEVKCSFCNVKVQRFDLDTHAGNCPEGPRVCPLHCGDEMPR